MARIYAELIIEGYKTLDEVPLRLREKVAELLESISGGDLNV